jgi:hypothetical protein
MALAATIDWECQNGGAANYGGGFNRSASGTDRSQSTTPWVEVDQSAVVCTIQSTTTLLRFTLGYTVTTADVGNLFYVTGGSGATVGWYEITGVDTGNNDWVLDRAIGVAGTAPTGNMGGCLNHPGDIVQSTSPLLAGHRLYCKGAFTLTSSNDLNAPAIANFYMEGYTTTRGDGARPTWTASGSSVVMLTLNSGSATGWTVKDIIFDGNLQTSCRGLALTAGQITFINCCVKRFNNIGVNASIVNWFINCEFLDNVTTNAFNGNATVNHLIGCRFAGNTATCFVATNASRNQFIDCLWHDNTGASTDGVQSSHAGAYFNFVNCTIDGCGRHGINLQANASIGAAVNVLLTKNGGYGLSTTATNPVFTLINCADWDNTSGATTGLDSARIYGSVNLSGDPYTDRSSDDYSLNNTSGAGAACRDAGYPAALNAFQTNRNIGAFDVAAGGGGSAGMLVHPGMSGGARG